MKRALTVKQSGVEFYSPSKNIYAHLVIITQPRARSLLESVRRCSVVDFAMTKTWEDERCARDVQTERRCYKKHSAKHVSSR